MSAADKFINPYTFVPLPEITDPHGFKHEPAGHARHGAGRWGGRIEVELTARSPLLLRGVRRDDVRSLGRDGEVGRFPRRTFRETGADPVPFLPGSSLAGVVRSVHELLAGGCLRVFDGDYRPGYRDVAQARDKVWTLALVERVDNRRPTALRLCSEVAWAPAPRLAQVLGGPDRVVTGARVNIRDFEPKNYGRGRSKVRRNEVTQDHWVEPGDGWVVLVTDSGARRKRKSFWCAVGKLDDGLAEGVTDQAWEDFQHAVDGTEDVRRARINGDLVPDGPVPAEVEYQFPDGRRTVGWRHEARPGLHRGQVLWVRMASDTTKPQVAELALSHIWRHPGAHAAKKRVPKALWPCERPDELCPTCRVFGSADTSGADTPEARQHAYRGHLRFSDARPVGKVGLHVEKLPALGAPRPGAGQFYLQHNGTPPAEYGIPLREWGSHADSTDEPRRLRGRKQYWLTGRCQERPLFRVADRTWKSEMASTAQAAGAGSRFIFTVHFEGLDLAELGGLLAALDPSLLLGDGTAEIGFAVGGGRPFGFGTCTAALVGLDVDDPASRYAGGPAPQVSVPQAVDAFRARVDSRVVETWPAVTAALTLDQVEPGTVWYPPERPIGADGPLTAEDLQPKEVSLEFWKQTRGYRTKKQVYELKPLPGPEEPDQSLPVLRRSDRDKPRQGQSRRQGQPQDRGQGRGRGGRR